MSNKLYNQYTEAVKIYAENEEDTIRLIRDHLDKSKEAIERRDISSMLSGKYDKDANIGSLKKDLFNDLAFNYGSILDTEVIERLAKMEHIDGHEDEILQIFDDLNHTKKEKYLLSLIGLIDGGAELIDKHNLGDLTKIPYKTHFSCPHCNSDTVVYMTAYAIREGFVSTKECSGCGHKLTEDCSCDFCLRNKMIFDMAKLVEGSLDTFKSSINKTLKEHVDGYKVIENEVDKSKLLAQFMSYKGSLGKNGRQVVEKAIEGFKVSNSFDYETYEFTKNIVGEELASKTASELCRVGFFYKAGYIPRQDKGVDPILGLSGKSIRTIYLMHGGAIIESNEEPDDYLESATIYDGSSDLRATYEVKPYMLSVFKVNLWALEQEAFGGVYSADDRTEKLNGKILHNPSVREVFESEYKKDEYFIFPDVKIAKLIDLDMLSTVMNSATVSLLEKFEANLVCFDKEYNPKVIYLTSGRKGLSVIEAAVAPLLKTAGVEIKII